MSNKGKIEASSELLLPNPLWDKFVNDMSNKDQIDKAFDLLRDCFQHGGKLLLCGNGGSAADCDHIAAELVKGMTKITKGLPAISLCSNTAILTAIANDLKPSYIFSQQVKAYGKPGDVILGITTSGYSEDVLFGLGMGREKSLKAIGLTGPDNGKLYCYCDLIINCPGSTTAEIQEQHIKVYHELCRRLEKEFYP